MVLWMQRFSAIVWSVEGLGRETYKVIERVGYLQDLLGGDPPRPLTRPPTDSLLRDVAVREFHVPANRLDPVLQELLSSDRSIRPFEGVALDGLSFGIDCGPETPKCITWHETDSAPALQTAFDRVIAVLREFGAPKEW